MNKKYFLILVIVASCLFMSGSYFYKHYSEPTYSIKNPEKLRLELRAQGVSEQEIDYILLTGKRFPKNIPRCRIKGRYGSTPTRQYSFWEVEKKEDSQSLNQAISFIKETYNINKFQRFFLENPPSQKLISECRAKYKNIQVLRIKLLPVYSYKEEIKSLPSGRGSSDCLGTYLLYFRQCISHFQRTYFYPSDRYLISDKLDRRYNLAAGLQILEPEELRESYGDKIIVYFGETGCEDPVASFIPEDAVYSFDKELYYYVILSGEKIDGNYYSYNPSIIKRNFELDFNEPGYVLLGAPVN